MRTISPQPVAPDAVDRKAVARVAARAELEDIRLREAHAAIQVAPDELSDDWSDWAFMGYDSHATGWSDDRSTFAATVSFFVGYREAWNGEGIPTSLEDEPGPDLDAYATFELTYTLSEPTELTEEDLEHFAVYNSTFNAWPYWRELAQTATQRMRITPLMVPLLRVSELRSEDAEANTPPEDDANEQAETSR